MTLAGVLKNDLAPSDREDAVVLASICANDAEGGEARAYYKE